MKIYANDGKEFKGDNPHHLVDECNAYEVDIKLKKAQEEVERKAKEAKREVLANSIKEQFESLKNDINIFKELGGSAVRISNSEILHCNKDGSICVRNYSRGYIYMSTIDVENARSVANFTNRC